MTEDPKKYEDTSLISKDLLGGSENDNTPRRRISPILAIVLAILLVPCALWSLHLVTQNARINRTLVETRTINTNLNARLFENESLLKEMRTTLAENKTALNAAKNEIAEVQAERDRLNELVNSQAKMLEEQTAVIDALEAANTSLEAAYKNAMKRLEWARVILKRFADKLIGMGFTEEEITAIRYARDKKPVAKQWQPVVEELDWKVWVATRCIEERPDRELHPEQSNVKETKPVLLATVFVTQMMPSNNVRVINYAPDIEEIDEETVETAETPVLTTILPVPDHDMAEIAVSNPEPDPEPEPEVPSHICGIASHISEASSVITNAEAKYTQPVRDVCLLRDVGHTTFTICDSSSHCRNPDLVNQNARVPDPERFEAGDRHWGQRQNTTHPKHRRPGIVELIARSDPQGHPFKEPRTRGSGAAPSLGIHSLF